MNLVSFDLETWGLLPEYALQPYRARTGDAWITSFATDGGNAPAGELSPSKETLRAWLQDCAEFNKRIVGWNTAFDVAWLIAVGLREEVYKCKWLDAMLMWRHLTVRPEFAIPEGLQQNFSLKNAVRTYIPEHANYEDGVSFDPNDDPEKLLEYNKLEGSISARAEEPHCTILRQIRLGVDLRACGGTEIAAAHEYLGEGRSPRVRRNQGFLPCRLADFRSISARAEEPTLGIVGHRQITVDLRACGGTRCRRPGRTSSPGRSPRVRRNRMAWRLMGQLTGSISARAEEPRMARHC